jgi:hypothetical protein
MNVHIDSKFGKRTHDVGIKVGHRTRKQPHLLERPIVGRYQKYVPHKIKLKLKCSIAVRNWGCGQAHRRYIERDVPRMV